MNLVYLVTVHKNPSQILRLIERLDDPGNNFIIHVDKRRNNVYRELTAALADHPRVHFAKRVSVRWGTVKLVEAKLNALHKLVQLGLDFEFAITCSGQDYPLKSNTEIKNKLAQYRGKEMIEISPLPRKGWGDEGGLDRFKRYHLLVDDHKLTFPPYTMTGWKGFVTRLLPKFIKERPPLEYVPFGGADWYCMTREASFYIHDFFVSPEGRALLRRFRFTSNSAEIVFHTLLGNSPFLDKVADYFPWHIDWSDNKPNPAVFTQDRFEELVHSDKLFARKFDIDVDSKILDMLDEHILG
jgi:hypothetical protein